MGQYRWPRQVQTVCYLAAMSHPNRQTEQQLTEYVGLDTWTDEKILTAMIAVQKCAIAAVESAIPQISIGATAIAARLAKGGHLYYAGAGTSIRVGVQDGSELPATFGMSEDTIGYLIAGGQAAVFETFADAEDDAEAGSKAAENCTAADVVIAIAASGSTPFTIAAARRAKRNGAYTIAVVNNPDTELAATADLEIFLPSGPEVISGSTRMGAGTAQKAALNLLSTLAHIKCGAVYDSMMVNMRAENAKLKARARVIISRIAAVTEQQAEAALQAAAGKIKPAVLLCAGIASFAAAEKLLAENNQNLRQALRAIQNG
jgi:N-acetylmuramic acid 6-phosphate etherase